MAVPSGGRVARLLPQADEPMLIDPKVKAQMQRYLRILLWMLRDSFRLFRKDMIIVLVTSVVGVLMQGGVLGIILMYANYLEKDKSLHLMGMALEPRSQFTLFAVGGVAFVLLIISALLIYISKQRTAIVSVDYEEFCSKRVFGLHGARPQQPMREYNAPNVMRMMAREQTINPQGCGRALLTVLSGAFPLVIFLYMTAFLAWLSIEVMAIIAVLFLIFLRLHYRVNVFVVENEDRIMRLQPQSRRNLQQLFHRFKSHGRSAAALDRHLDAAYAADAVRDSFDGIRNRRMSVARADLASNIMIAVAMSVVVVYLGRQALLGHIPWGQVIVYLVVLRMAVMGFRSVLNTIANYARWYPKVRDYHAFVSTAAPEIAAGDDDIQLVVRNLRHCGDLETCVLQKGDVAGLVTPVNLNRYTLFYFIDEILCSDDDCSRLLRRHIDFIPNRPFINRNISLREFLGAPAAADWSGLRSQAPAIAFLDKLERTANGSLDCRLTDALLNAMSETERLQMSLLAAYLRRGKVLILRDRALTKLEPVARTAWVRAFADRILIIAYARKRLADAGSFGEEIVIVGNKRGQCAVAGIGWVRENRERVLDLLYLNARDRDDEDGDELDESGSDMGELDDVLG